MSITQLSPPLPFDTVKGKGWAHFLIDYGQEAHLMWVVFLDKSGECWTIPNTEIRLQPNWTENRRFPTALSSDLPQRTFSPSVPDHKVSAAHILGYPPSSLQDYPDHQGL